MNIQDKVILITGSSSGIGKTAAIRLAAKGAKVVVNYRENKKGGEDTCKNIKDGRGECMLAQADITDEQQVKSMIAEIIQKWGRIDVLINNGAIPHDQVPYFESPLSEMQKLVNTDLVAPMFVSQQVIPIMQKRKQGKIINTSSIKGWEHGGGSVVYAASKAGLNSFTRTLAKHVAPDIQVNAVAPGYVKTRSYDGMTAEKMQTFLGQTVLKRWVTEDEIADAFVFLIENDAMTGQVIYVDAGFTLK